MTEPFYNIDSFEPQRSIGYLIRQVSKFSTQQIDADFAGRDLTMTHWCVLALIRHGVADTGARIARQLGHDSGATTRLIDQLESRGLVERRRCSEDRRMVFLTCTEAGLAQLNALTPLLMGIWNDVLKGFERSEIETLIASLCRLVAAFEARDAGQTELAA